MSLLLFNLVLLNIEVSESPSAVGEPVALNALPQTEVDVFVVADLAGSVGGELRCRVVIETSVNGEDFLPAASVELTGTGHKVMSAHLDRLYQHVRARLELRGSGATVRALTCTLASSVPLVREASKGSSKRAQPAPDPAPAVAQSAEAEKS